MVMYIIYNSDTLEKLIDIVYKLHNKTTWNERQFVSKLKDWYQWYLIKEGSSTLCHKFSFVHNHDERKIF